MLFEKLTAIWLFIYEILSPPTQIAHQDNFNNTWKTLHIREEKHQQQPIQTIQLQQQQKYVNKLLNNIIIIVWTNCKTPL